VVNATRTFSEIEKKISNFKPIRMVELECICTASSEAVFRPAIYKVEKCVPLKRIFPEVDRVSQVVSMIGLYRDIVRVGEKMRVKGNLEEFVNGQRRFRVVVGSTSPGEYIDWIGP
jgi:predicted nucleotidyltransferase